MAGQRFGGRQRLRERQRLRRKGPFGGGRGFGPLSGGGRAPASPSPGLPAPAPWSPPRRAALRGPPERPGEIVFPFGDSEGRGKRLRRRGARFGARGPHGGRRRRGGRRGFQVPGRCGRSFDRERGSKPFARSAAATPAVPEAGAGVSTGAGCPGRGSCSVPFSCRALSGPRGKAPREGLVPAGSGSRTFSGGFRQPRCRRGRRTDNTGACRQPDPPRRRRRAPGETGAFPIAAAWDGTSAARGATSFPVPSAGAAGRAPSPFVRTGKSPPPADARARRGGRFPETGGPFSRSFPLRGWAANYLRAWGDGSDRARRGTRREARGTTAGPEPDPETGAAGKGAKPGKRRAAIPCLDPLRLSSPSDSWPPSHAGSGPGAGSRPGIRPSLEPSLNRPLTAPLAGQNGRKERTRKSRLSLTRLGGGLRGSDQVLEDRERLHGHLKSNRCAKKTRIPV